MQDAEEVVYNLVHISPYDHHPASTLGLHYNNHLRSTSSASSDHHPRLTFNMKWFLALAPLAAALPSLPTVEVGDAPPAGTVSYLQDDDFEHLLNPHRSRSEVSAMAALDVLRAP